MDHYSAIMQFSGFVVLFISSNGFSEENREIDPLKIVESAYESSMNGFNVGKGTGEFTLFTFENGKKTIKQNCQFSFSNHGHQYKLTLKYSPPEDGGLQTAHKRVVLCDGDEILAINHSRFINPFGCDSNRYDNTPGAIARATGGFIFDPTTLPYHYMGKDWFNKPQVKFSVDENQSIHAVYNLNKRTRVQIYCLPEFGFNIGRIEISNPVTNTTSRVITQKWKQRENVWTLSEIESTATPKGKLKYQQNLKIIEFRSTTPEEISFKLEDSDTCENMREIDRRNPAGN